MGIKDVTALFNEYAWILRDVKIQGENIERDRALELIDRLTEPGSPFTSTQKLAMITTLARCVMAGELDDDAERELQETEEWLTENQT